jgi:hypothetical protein
MPQAFHGVTLLIDTCGVKQRFAGALQGFKRHSGYRCRLDVLHRRHTRPKGLGSICLLQLVEE